MELEPGGLGGREVEFEGAIAAVLEELDARKRGAKPYMKRTPMAGLGQRKAQALDGVAEKPDLRHAGEPAAFPEHEVGMKMADDSAFDLAEAGADGVVMPQGGQRGGVMAKKNDAARGFQVGEGAADFGKMLLAQLAPSGAFGGERVRFQHGQGQEGRGHAQEQVVPRVNPPEQRQVQFSPRAVQGGESHAAASAEKTELAEIMVAEGGAEIGREPGAEFLEAFARAVQRRIVGHADEAGVAGVIAVGDDEVRGAGAFEELAEQMIVAHGMAEPEEMPVMFDEVAAEGVGQVAVLVIVAARLFGGAGVMDVADDGNPVVAGHAASWALAAGKEIQICLRNAVLRLAGGWNRIEA